MVSLWTSNLFPKLKETLGEKNRFIFYMTSLETVSFPASPDKECQYCSEIGKLRKENAMLKKRILELEKKELKKK